MDSPLRGSCLTSGRRGVRDEPDIRGEGAAPAKQKKEKPPGLNKKAWAERQGLKTPPGLKK